MRNLGGHRSSVFGSPEGPQSFGGSLGIAGVRNYHVALADRPIAYLMCLLHISTNILSAPRHLHWSTMLLGRSAVSRTFPSA
eukprot:2046910-Pyramimonas_sp.AAC.1